MSPYPSIPEGSVFSQVIISRAHQTSMFRSLPLGFTTTRVTFDNGWMEADSSKKNTSKVDRALLPLVPAIDVDGRPLHVTVETRSGPIHAKVWQLAVWS